MNKYLVIILIMITGLTSCAKKDEQYYRANPLKLQKALKNCPNQQPEGLTCPQIEQLGSRLNQLVYELQFNPQTFGNKILSIQQTIVQQKLDMKNNETNSELKSALEKNEHDLADHLAVVKWLESPES